MAKRFAKRRKRTKRRRRSRPRCGGQRTPCEGCGALTRRADLWPIAKVRPRTGAVASAGDFCRACVDKLKAEAEAAGQPWLRIPELFED